MRRHPRITGYSPLHSQPSPKSICSLTVGIMLRVTAAGGGYSRWRDLAITRWREDSTRDCWGTFCYVRDVTNGEFWSVAQQPTKRRPASYEAIYSQGRAEFRRRDGDIETHLEISVSPEDDIELRRISITNRGRSPRTIELTTYAEVVLAPGGGGRGSSSVQQSVCADTACPRPPGNPLHSPAALGIGTDALHAASDDRLWRGGRFGVLRNFARCVRGSRRGHWQIHQRCTKHR